MKTLKIIIFSITTILSVLLFCNTSHAQACPAGQNCIYVSKSKVLNHDANASIGSEQNPYPTIQKAINSVSGGTSIRIFGDTYNERIVIYQKSGTYDNRIILSSYKGRVIIDGGTAVQTTVPQPLLKIQDCSYVQINGITFQNNYGPQAEGIRIEGTGVFPEIVNCTIRQIGWTNNRSQVPGTLANGARNDNHKANPLRVIGTKSTAITETLIRDNEIYNCITGYSESLTLVGNVDNFLVARNKVYDNTNIGIVAAGHYGWVTNWLPEAGPTGIANQARNGRIEENEVYNCNTPPGIDQSAGIYVDGGAYIQVRRNKSYGNDVGFSIGCEQCKSSNQKAFGNILESNWAYNNNGAGLVLGSGTYSQPRMDANGNQIMEIHQNTPTQDIQVYNNTFYRNSSTNPGSEVVLQNNNNSQFKQNIVVINRLHDRGLAQYGSFSTTNLQVGNNLYWQGVALPEGVTRDASYYYYNGGSNSINYSGNDLTPADPRLVSPIDLHLSPNSPAINQGDPNFNSSITNTTSHFVDIDVTPRIKGGRVDIGAHELR